MIKFITIAITLIMFLIFSIPFMLILVLMKKINNKLASSIGQRVVKNIFKFMIFISGSKVEIRGLENIPQNETVLFVGNHRGVFDILLAYAYTPKIFGFIAKKEMLKYPLLRDWMYIVNCLFLDRENIKEGLKTILEAIEKVKSGISIWVFPEGTRSNTNSELDLLEFKEGSFKIATKAGVAIVPVLIKGSREIFENQFPKVKASNIVLEYLEPIYADRLDKNLSKKIGEYTRNIILNSLKEK